MRATSPWWRTRSSAKPERPEPGLGPLHRGEPAERDRGAVGQAATRGRPRRGLSQVREAELARDLAHAGLGEPGVDEREGRAALAGGPLAGAVVVEVVDVHAEAHRGALGRRRSGASAARSASLHQ